MKKLLERLQNTGTLIAVICGVGALINQFYPNLVDPEWLKATIDIFCSVGIALGILNNPTTPKLDNPFKLEEGK